MPGSMISTEPPCTCLSFCFPCNTWRNVSHSKLGKKGGEKILEESRERRERREGKLFDKKLARYKIIYGVGRCGGYIWGGWGGYLGAHDGEVNNLTCGFTVGLQR